jgi:hypothetical protein
MDVRIGSAGCAGAAPHALNVDFARFLGFSAADPGALTRQRPLETVKFGLDCQFQIFHFDFKI